MAGDHTFVGSQPALLSAFRLPPQCLAARVRTPGQCVAGFIQGWGGALLVIREEGQRVLESWQKCIE